MITEIAPAKINLYLHVGPVRRDGLHELASLFVFAADGDRLSAEPAPDLSLRIVGPFAPALAGFAPESNLVLRAARALRRAAGVEAGAALTLDKRLPVAAGLGGGSADAAAALRALTTLWRIDIGEASLRRLAFSLGADIPACLSRAPVMVSGAGERIAPGPRLPPFWVCLVNPGVETPTGPVFRAFDRANPAPPPPKGLGGAAIGGLAALRSALLQTRNDLELPAISAAPAVGAARAMLSSCPGCLHARMSGSGATIFGVFASASGAERASRRAAAQGWWSAATKIGVAAGVPQATAMRGEGRV